MVSVRSGHLVAPVPVEFAAGIEDQPRCSTPAPGSDPLNLVNISSIPILGLFIKSRKSAAIEWSFLKRSTYPVFWRASPGIWYLSCSAGELRLRSYVGPTAEVGAERLTITNTSSMNRHR